MDKQTSYKTLFYYHTTLRPGLRKTIIKTIKNDALEELKSEFGKALKKDRKNPAAFLNLVASTLAPFNQSIPGAGEGILRFDALPPQGMANAVLMALGTSSKGFDDFVKKNGQRNVYLAALALSLESDDVISIALLSALLQGIKKSKVSKTRSNIAKWPRSPFKKLICKVLAENKDGIASEIWSALKGCHGDAFDLNGWNVEINLEFFNENKDEQIENEFGYVKWITMESKEGKFKEKKGTFKRSSLDGTINDLRETYGLHRSI